MTAGFRDYASKLGSEAEFNAASDAWDSKNAYATQISGMAGVYGFNAGSLAPGAKPTDTVGLAMSGNLGASGERAARYSGGAFLSSASSMTSSGQAAFGSSLYQSNWGDGFDRMGAVSEVKSSLGKDVKESVDAARDLLGEANKY
jgi:type IV secretory pathway TrbL component